VRAITSRGREEEVEKEVGMRNRMIGRWKRTERRWRA